VAERAYLPTLSVAASRSHTGRDFSADLPDIAQRDNSVALQLAVPIFDGFARHYQVRAAEADVDLARADLKSVEQRVALEVWQAFQSLQSETEALSSTEKLLGFATKSLEVAQGRFKAGVGSTLELLEAQRAMADAAAYEAEDSRRKERLDLHNQAEVLAYKVDEALSKCKKELDKEEKNRIKADVANLRRCLRKDKPEKMNETEEANLRQAKSQLEASANHLMVLYASEQSENGSDGTI
jgi:hypothetical protein